MKSDNVENVNHVWYYTRMMNMKVRLILLVSIVLLFSGCTEDRDKANTIFDIEPEPEEYAVYSSLLEGNFNGDKRERDEIIVISETTVPISVRKY